MSARPNILLILTDQQREPPPYETEELAAFRRANCPGETRLREEGVSFARHYPMATACAPSRTSLLTGHYPSLHGVTQTDGAGKIPDGPEMRWLAEDSVPTLGDWFRSGGYRTFYKGKWHVSHAHLTGEDGEDLVCVDDDGEPQPDNIARYQEADLLEPWGFAEWVGPEPHGLAPHSMGKARDPYTAQETVELLGRLAQDGDETPWLTVCSFLNPHDVAYFGVFGMLKGGQRYAPRTVPPVPDAPTRDEDLSTKPTCQQSMVDLWGRLMAPQPFIEPHRRYYYEMQAAVDEQIGRVLDALDEHGLAEDTIVVFTSDHGDMLGAHGGMHQKWHNAYEEALRVPFVVRGPGVDVGETQALEIPTSHADVLPTLLGLAGIDPAAALAHVARDHHEAHPPVERDLSAALRGEAPPPEAQPVLFMTDDEISEGDDPIPMTPGDLIRRIGLYQPIAQPNHIETVVAVTDVGGEPHVVKLSRYHDNPQFWTVPGERDERARRRRTRVVVEPEPDEWELYDLTLDPLEERNLAHPSHADEDTRALQRTMTDLLRAELAAKRLTPAGAGLDGYLPPAAAPA